MARKKRIVSLGDMENLRQRGVSLPQHPARARAVSRQMMAMATDPGRLERDVRRDTQADKDARRAERSAERQLRSSKLSGVVNPEQLEQNMKVISAYRTTHGRGLGRRIASSASDVSAAIPRFFDPLEYWDLSGMPFNMADEAHRHKLHKWARLYYATHPIIPTLVDIFTRFPLSGLELYSPDKKLTAFYEDLFLENSKLNYEDFLVSMGREYWLVGEAFPLASFNESLGVFDREELLNPEDIIVERVPMLGATYLKVKPPEHMKRLVQQKSPPKEYKMLQENFPELIPYLMRGKPFPISTVLLKHIKFSLTDWDDHGTPILLRALRTLMHEEKLLASQDAIAERLYSPLILAKLGIQDLGGGQGAWFPGPDALDDLRDAMDIALSSDFRLLVHHFGLDISNVFGREQMPDLSNDFDRIERRLMEVFGVNPSLLSGGTNSQPYASSALQAEFMNQMLRTYQRFLKEHYKSRALIVAEAQEHWEYEKRGNTRVPIMEEVVEMDEEGNITVEQKHKLMIPDMEMATLDLRDEATERQYLMALRQMGLPISDERLMASLPFEFEDSLDEMTEEAIQKTVEMQMGKVQVYKICVASGTPIPPDLKAEVESVGAPPMPAGAAGAGGPGGAGMAGGPMGAPQPGPGDVGGGGNMVMPEPPGDLAKQLGPGKTPGGGPPTTAPMQGGPAGSVPDISSERMTHVASLTSEASTTLSIERLEQMIAAQQEIIVQVEVRKGMRRLASKVRRTVLTLEEQVEHWHYDGEKRKISKVSSLTKDDGQDGGWDLSAKRKVIKIAKAKKAMKIASVPFTYEEMYGEDGDEDSTKE